MQINVPKVIRRKFSSQEVTNIDPEVAKMARKIANKRARLEILPQLSHMTSPENMKKLRGQSRSWEPFRDILQQKYGYTLNTRDAMVIEIMKTPALFEELEQIGVDSMREAMFDSTETQTFIQSLVNQLRAS